MFGRRIMKTETETKKAELYVSECLPFRSDYREEPNHHAMSDEPIWPKTRQVDSYSASGSSRSGLPAVVNVIITSTAVNSSQREFDPWMLTAGFVQKES